MQSRGASPPGTQYDRSQWGRYLGRFALLHVAAYAVVGTAALALLGALTPADRVAIDFFEPYRLGIGPLAIELLRGLVLALVFVPFYRTATRSRRGWPWLFAALWGLTVVGSIDPWPGSVEGVIYTETTVGAHLFFLTATAVQYGLLVGALWWTETRRPIRSPTPSSGGRTPRGHRATAGYLSRFTLVYVVAYLLAGISFYVLSDYEIAIGTGAAFALWRPLDHPFVQFAVAFQVVRGALFAGLLYPLYGRIVDSSRGWTALFWVLWGATYLGAPPTVRNLLGDLLSPGPLTDLLFGTAEITVQMAAFAVVFWAWQRRAIESGSLLSRILAGTARRFSFPRE